MKPPRNGPGSPKPVEEAISYLEGKRAALGDEAVDAALAALRRGLGAPQRAGAGEEQRKQVTVLFADVSGFTALSEKLDAEDLRDLMKDLWQRLDSVIVGHGGAIDKHIGDAVMAVWGVTRAQEDDPVRAVKAALEIKAETERFGAARKSPLVLHSGINTGPVLLGEVGSKGEFTAMGDAVNVASRLKDHAPAGAVLISQDTERLLKASFETQPMPSLKVKGKREPLKAFLVLRPKRRTGAGHPAGAWPESPFVGRGRAMALLQGAYEESTSGKLRIVLLTGEAGIGKTRLLREFSGWMAGKRGYGAIRGRADREAQGVPYGLLKDLFAHALKIRDGCSQAEAQAKLEEGVGAVFGRGKDAPMKSHFIGYLLGFGFRDSPHLKGIPQDARQMRDRALFYLADYLRAVSGKSPAAFLLEDLHWADEASLEAVLTLAGGLSKSQLCLVATARPDFLEHRPGWGSSLAGFERHELEPLSGEESHSLLEGLLGPATQAGGPFSERLFARAEGNPYYIEQMTSMMVDDGVILRDGDHWRVDEARASSVRIPPTLTAVLQARFDALTPAEKTVLQRASVLGQVFWDKAVTTLGGAGGAAETSRALAALRGRGMIRLKEAATFPETDEYAFRHALLRDAVYETVLKRDRKELHARAARWLERRAGTRKGEMAGLIAAHLEAAGEGKKAAACLHMAGLYAASQFANDQALDYFGRALIHLEGGPAADRFRALHSRQQVLDLLGRREEQRRDIEAMEGLVPSLGRAEWAEAALCRARLDVVTGDYPSAVRGARAAAAFVAGSRTPSGRTKARRIEALIEWTWGRALFQSAQYDAAHEHLGRTVTLARSAGMRHVETDAMRDLGRISNRRGEIQEARAIYESCARVAGESGDRRGESLALDLLSNSLFYAGEFGEGLRCAERALELAEETGDRRAQCIIVNSLGEQARWTGDLDTALRHYEKAAELARDVGEREFEGIASANLALTLHNLGRNEQAEEEARRAIAVLKTIGVWNRVYVTTIALGHVRLALGDHDEASEAYDLAHSKAKELGEAAAAMESAAGQAAVALSRGRTREAVERIGPILDHILVAEAKDRATGYPPRHHLEGADEPFRVYHTCYQVLEAARDPRASGFLARAWEALSAQAKKLPAGKARSAFFGAVPSHRGIREAWDAACGESSKIEG